MTDDLVTRLRRFDPMLTICHEAADEIEAMRTVGISQERIIMNIQAERDALRADAARYRWIKNIEPWEAEWVIWNPDGGDLDATIDARIRGVPAQS